MTAPDDLPWADARALVLAGIREHNETMHADALTLERAADALRSAYARGDGLLW
ncbi:hypothetical protein [Microbacterium xylanilyticum]